jgi:hypothetical protein
VIAGHRHRWLDAGLLLAALCLPATVLSVSSAWAGLRIGKAGPAPPKSPAASLGSLQADLDRPAAPFRLAAAGPERARALLCLTDAIYYEAALEPTEGQEAVAQIVLNRVRHPAFPKSICGVVFQGSTLATGCQFSFTCDGSMARPPIAPFWQRARAVAERALSGYVMAGVGEATHYHADYVLPGWAPTLVRLGQFGSQIFYRFPGPAGEPGSFHEAYGGGETRVALAWTAPARGLSVEPAGSSRVSGQIAAAAPLPGREDLERIGAALASLPRPAQPTVLAAAPPPASQ